MPATALDELRLLRPRETAETLAISLRELDHLVETGVLKPVRLTPRGNRRFRATDVRALVTTKED